MTPDEALLAIADALAQHGSDSERITAIRVILAEKAPPPPVEEALALARGHAARIPAGTSAVGSSAKAAILALAHAVESLQASSSLTCKLCSEKYPAVCASCAASLTV